MQTHHFPLRVYYEDTDAGGVVYYANYLRFCERARTELLRAQGAGQAELARERGLVFVVAEARARYLRPARLDDALDIETHIGERGASFAVFEQRVLREGQVLCQGQFRVACVDATSFRPTRIPPDIAAALAPFTTDTP